MSSHSEEIVREALLQAESKLPIPDERWEEIQRRVTDIEGRRRPVGAAIGVAAAVAALVIGVTVVATIGDHAGRSTSQSVTTVASQGSSPKQLPSSIVRQSDGPSNSTRPGLHPAPAPYPTSDLALPLCTVEDVQLRASWTDVQGSLDGTIVATGLPGARCMMNQKPEVQPVNEGGQPLQVHYILTLEALAPRIPEYLMVGGQQFSSTVRWGPWCGSPTKMDRGLLRITMGSLAGVKSRAAQTVTVIGPPRPDCVTSSSGLRPSVITATWFTKS